MTATKKEEMAAQRARYMAGELTHEQYYLWLSDWIGIPDSFIPFSNEQVQRSTDPHLNDLPLGKWDEADFLVRQLATGLPWALSDTVCCLKAMARRRAGK